MRDFKFRVWSQAEKEWSNTSMLEVWDNSGVLKPFAWMGHPTENYIIQQFTGLKDETGKDIYEGDIIEETYDRLRGLVSDFDKSKTKINDGLWTYGHFVYISEVSWSDMYSGFHVTRRRLTGEKEEAGRFPLNGKNVKIIGNIFENPELIKS